MLKSRAERSSLNPIRLRPWLAFLGKPCMGAVTQIRDLDSTPRAEHNYTFLESDHFMTNERRAQIRNSLCFFGVQKRRMSV